MKMIKMSAFVLLSGLFLASCGDGAHDDETTTDTTIAVPVMEEAPAVPETVNGIDTTVNVNGNGNMNSGGNGDNSNPDNTNRSTSGQPTQDPGKSPNGGHPAKVPDKSSTGSPNM